MGFSPEQHNDRKGVKILPGEVFCWIEFEDGILCPTAKSFSSTSGLIRHIRGQHELDIQTWDGKWEGCDAEEKSKGGRPTGQAIAKALVMYKQWNKLISAEDEAAEKAWKQTVNQRFAEERADKAQRFSEKRESTKQDNAGRPGSRSNQERRRHSIKRKVLL
ncbi:uncharacterized protein QC763_210835 [Podospora pseudopauciseta]|uniref:C2H2-type domain-containing protein n=1 Tax=Podospora pseudopauciseta TaxID=2093780 RepID=A0ABR0HR03_9PEZI|nr:hypothetical protein QC763_210835 [Podospora pseudopauciseta]